ncbi:L-tyrosine/L-tryptophan isonitrile synthase family protein [Psychromarinibacter sp. S121]|uniref:L-tyrosine/L-tryptophan isonitrile synthase family protein n=1 Tax=Psychromarinibacter sp. S121 TaxID=3415127 RepID=UPI003C7CF7BB
MKDEKGASSPYIYINSALPTSYVPPAPVSETTLDAAGLRALLATNDVTLTPASDGTTAERILSIFELPDVLFGDPSFIPANRDKWIEKFNHFIADGKPIQFVAMAFPYKVPNPLKNERAAPDLGEALMLRRFQAVMDAVASVYTPGGVLTILEEGILGRCQGVSPKRVQAYRDGIEGVMQVSGVDPERITFHSLDDMGEKIPNFEARWIHEQERLRELWQQGDPAMRAAYETTTAAQRTSVPTLDYEGEVLAKAYDLTQTDSALRYPRDYIDKVAHRQFFAYRSVLSLRDVTGYLHDLRPNAVKLTVSPKAENLAVLPVNTQSKILPYHGVPVQMADGSWEIRYRAEVGTLGKVEALRYDADTDAAPIGYRVIE